MSIIKINSKSTLIVIILGLIGGLTLIMASRWSTIGRVQILPYPLVLIVTSIIVYYFDCINFNFRTLFLTNFGVFLFMTTILYLFLNFYIIETIKLNFWGHFWRLGLLIIIGVVSSLFTAGLFNAILSKNLRIK